MDYLKIVIVGHVDHGKSTFIGRLFNDTGMLPEGKLEQLQNIAESRGVPFEWANLMDGLKAERDQNITIDTAQIWFKTQKRTYVIIDAPGHKEFLKNMVTGAAQADAALLLIDAKERIQEQTKRHAYLLRMLGIRQLVVLVNKMDSVEYSESVFGSIKEEFTKNLASFEVGAPTFIPISARNGDNIAGKSNNMGWWTGASVLQALDAFTMPPSREHLPMRFPVQDVYRFDHRRILVGRVESGTIRVGDKVSFMPSGKESEVKTIERYPLEFIPNEDIPSLLTGASIPRKQSEFAVAGESIGVTLTEQVFVERGHVAYNAGVSGPRATKEFKARIFWMGRPFGVGKKFVMKSVTQEADAYVKSVHSAVDSSSLEPVLPADIVQKNTVSEVTLSTKIPVSLDLAKNIVETGRIVLMDGGIVSGGGLVTSIDDSLAAPSGPKSSNIDLSSSRVTREERAYSVGHKGMVVWLTGLSGSGKSTLARAVERDLFYCYNQQAYVLDGDNFRHGLNSDLGFGRSDRFENIRRIGEVASVMADAGIIVLVSLISPYRSARDAARHCCEKTGIPFIEVWVECPVEVCEKRDPKGLYKKARAGDIKEFTGIDDPYECPRHPNLIVNTAGSTLEECVCNILCLVHEHVY
jgi:bifunctional enzyme CysN/CysC